MCWPCSNSVRGHPCAAAARRPGCPALTWPAAACACALAPTTSCWAVLRRTTLTLRASFLTATASRCPGGHAGPSRCGGCNRRSAVAPAEACCHLHGAQGLGTKVSYYLRCECPEPIRSCSALDVTPHVPLPRGRWRRLAKGRKLQGGFWDRK